MSGLGPIAELAGWHQFFRDVPEADLVLQLPATRHQSGEDGIVELSNTGEILRTLSGDLEYAGMK